MKDGIRRKGDGRKKSKKEKKEGDNLHPGKGKERKAAAFRKTPRFRLCDVFDEKRRIMRADAVSVHTE